MNDIKKKFAISKVINYLIIFTLIITMLILISSKSDTAFNIIGYRAYTILSGSMKPTYYPGDLVIVKNKSKTNLKNNDVITFIEDNQVVTHRIIKEIDNQYRTKGDNNNVEDSKEVKYENIIGKVSFKIPKAGYVVQFLSGKYVIAIELILLGAFVLIYSKD